MNKKLWNKLTKYQQMLWTVLNDKFLGELTTNSSNRLDSIAHNLALIAVWEVGGDKVKIKFKGIPTLNPSKEKACSNAKNNTAR